MGWLARRLFGIPIAETSFSRRGFDGGSAAARERLEGVAGRFVEGYHAGLESPDLESLAHRLGAVNAADRGFAFEGAAMALALLDLLTPGRADRLGRFLAGAGEPHVYMAHVGAGWAVARLPRLERRLISRLDPLLRWLAYDGYGFHEGFFHAPRTVGDQRRPKRLDGYARRAFDQGLGRVLWFVKVADVERVERAIARFPARRRGDLWSGIGLAATYAGGAPRDALLALATASGRHRAELAQGAAFAAKARLRAGNPTDHGELACRLFCDLPAAAAAAVSDRALEDLPADGELPAFEIWRRRIQEHFADRRDELAPRVASGAGAGR